jgi:1,4-dihydroxy-6-naphthoate synthase
MRLTLGHSPDPDDAFMFWALATGRIDSGPYRFEHVLQDIQTLNERARRGELHITAISIHAYAHVLDKYALLPSGSSMGDGYGPMIVCRRGRGLALSDVRELRIAIPGAMTTAALALQLCLGRELAMEVVMFDQIGARVRSGEFDAGVLIHEGQLTYADEGLELVQDLGAWWLGETGLPLPLGGNAIRKDLGRERIIELNRILRESIRMGLAHRSEALAHAMQYARGMEDDPARADRFVGMYVNDYTLDYGERGRRAVAELLRRGAAAGILPEVKELEFVG